MLDSDMEQFREDIGWQMNEVVEYFRILVLRP